MSDFTNKLKECADTVHMSDALKNRIMHVENATREYIVTECQRDKQHRKRIRMAYVYKCACITLLCVAMCSGVIWAIAPSGGDIFQRFFSKKTVQYAGKIYTENGKKYTIDDYTIELTQSIYDSKTNMGYVAFEVTQKNGIPKPEIFYEYVEQELVREMSENMNPEENMTISDFDSATEKAGCRFVWELSNGGTGMITSYEVIGETLSVYGCFTADKSFEHKINLIDCSSPENESDAYDKYEFVLEDKSDSLVYQIDDTTSISISPLGLVIDTKEILNRISLTIVFQDGEKQIITDAVDNQDIGFDDELMGMHGMTVNPGEKTGEKQVRYEYDFIEDLMDISNIDYILYNGKKYEASYTAEAGSYK